MQRVSCIRVRSAIHAVGWLVDVGNGHFEICDEPPSDVPFASELCGLWAAVEARVQLLVDREAAVLH